MNNKINRRYWMSICDSIANASTCRKQLAAILVMNNHIIGMGYVGSIRGDEHCDEQKDEPTNCLLVPNNGEYGSGDKTSCIRTMHAEMNAILNMQYPLYTVPYTERNITCYSTYQPCLNCLKALLQIGVRNFVYRNPYVDLNRDLYINNLSRKLLKSIIFYHFCKEEHFEKPNDPNF